MSTYESLQARLEAHEAEEARLLVMAVADLLRARLRPGPAVAGMEGENDA